MNDTALMLRNDAALSLEFTPQAARLKAAALELSATIGKVADEAGNVRAVAAQTEIAQLIKLVEEARVAAKDPILRFAANIEVAAKAFTEELRSEQWPISQLVGEFVQLQQSKARAAAALENNRLTELERQRREELATATDLDHLDRINEKYDIRAGQGAPSTLNPPPPSVPGQVVKEVWEYEVNDVWALARAHPGCVELRPRALEIKSALNAGVKLAGVRGWKVTKATVRLPATKKAIEA